MASKEEVRPIGIGDVVTWDHACHNWKLDWLVDNWGTFFIVTNVRKVGHVDVVPLRKDQWDINKSITPPPWYFYNVIRDDFLTEVYKSKHGNNKDK